MLYYRTNDWPGPLPNKLTMSDGRVVLPEYTAAEIAEAGYTVAPSQPTLQSYEVLGWDGSNWTVTDPRTLESAKNLKIEQVNKCRREEEVNFTYSGISLTLDSDTQSRINSAISGLERKPEGTTVYWQTGTIFTQFDLTSLAALGVAAFDHIESCFNNSRTLVQSIQACTTIAEVDAVDITIGWP